MRVPFTLSHPLAALLLRRIPVPLTAMIAGTMAPDLPLFLPGNFGYTFTHSVLGVVSVDLGIGLAGLALWMWVVRDALVDTAPAFVRDRLPAAAHKSPRSWALAPVAVIIGSLTHVGWDAFTHEGRWGVRHLAWLRAEHFGLEGYHWAQAVSTIVGLAVVLTWAASHLLRQPRRSRPAHVPELVGFAPAAALVVTAVAIVVAAAPHLSASLRDAAFAAAVLGTTTLGICVVVISALWHLLSRETLR